MSDILSSLAYLHGKPSAKAKLKAQPEHFKVNENLGFEFTGSGEHLMIHIRKTGENTTFVANEIAKVCGVKSKDVSWAGLKDRHAVTQQWLSVYLPKGEPDFSAFLEQYPSVQILQTTRHHQKLRPGDLIGNQFELVLSEVSDVEGVLKRLESIVQEGVPNYFGAQRFGHDGNNLSEARRWGKDNVRTRNQNQRSLYLSTARSWIFNQIVSDRITQGVINQFIEGDIAFEHGEEILLTDALLNDFNKKLQQNKVEITAALAGDNALPTKGAALILESHHLDNEPDLMALIRGNRMRHDRRSVILKPQYMAWETQENTVTLRFELNAGCFATSIVRELIEEIPVVREF